MSSEDYSQLPNLDTARQVSQLSQWPGSIELNPRGRFVLEFGDRKNWGMQSLRSFQEPPSDPRRVLVCDFAPRSSGGFSWDPKLRFALSRPSSMGEGLDSSRIRRPVVDSYSPAAEIIRAYTTARRQPENVLGGMSARTAPTEGPGATSDLLSRTVRRVLGRIASRAQALGENTVRVSVPGGRFNEVVAELLFRELELSVHGAGDFLQLLHLDLLRFASRHFFQAPWGIIRSSHSGLHLQVHPRRPPTEMKAKARLVGIIR